MSDFHESPIDLFAAIGRAIDLDHELDTYGRPGTANISYLHKKPSNNKEVLLCAYEMMRSAGINVILDYHPEEVETDKTLQAREIRLAAQKEKNAEPTL